MQTRLKMQQQLTMMAIRALSITVGTTIMNRIKNDTGSGQ